MNRFFPPFPFGQREIHRKLNLILAKLEIVMSELDDLKAADAKLQQAVLDVAQKLKDLAGQLGTGIDPAQVEAVAQDISAQADALEAAVANPGGTEAPPAG